MRIRNGVWRVVLIMTVLGLCAAFLPGMAASAGMMSPVYTFPNPDIMVVEGAGAMLNRGPNGATLGVMTTDLEPGAAYTVWWVFFNHPEYCTHPIPDISDCGEGDLEILGGDPAIMSSVMWATGHVVNPSGTASFSSHASVRKTTGEVLFGPGLVNVAGAEVHAVVRSHGPPIPGHVGAQLTTFGGGCTPDTGGDLPDGNACVDEQFAVFVP